MNKAQKIGICIGITILIIVTYASLNVYAISNLQFRAHQIGKFDPADMSIDTQVETCNPSFFPASFNKFDVDIIYKSTTFGTFTVWGSTIQPQSSEIVNGRLNVNAVAMAGLFLTALGSTFSGQQMDLDVNQIHYVTNLDAPIFGVIPFSIKKEYSSNEFKNIMSGQTGRFDC